MVTGVTSLSQITLDIDEIEQLIDAAKKKDALNTTKELTNLLIEYILAKMSGDSSGAQAISAQLTDLLNKYSADIQKADALVDKLKAVANDPSQQTPSELAYLQGLIPILERDAESGNMVGF